MPGIIQIACIIVTSLLLDWLCKPVALSRLLYLFFLTTGIATCTHIGSREVLYWNGGEWSVFLILAGFPLLFERSRWFDREP